jgi:hypothetical protein
LKIFIGGIEMGYLWEIRIGYWKGWKGVRIFIKTN